MSSNVAQSYPYTTETESERALKIAGADGAVRWPARQDRGRERAVAYDDPEEPGRPNRMWVFVCPKHVSGRLHVAGYARERHALFAVCDEGGETYLR